MSTPPTPVSRERLLFCHGASKTPFKPLAGSHQPSPTSAVVSAAESCLVQGHAPSWGSPQAAMDGWPPLPNTRQCQRATPVQSDLPFWAVLGCHLTHLSSAPPPPAPAPLPSVPRASIPKSFLINTLPSEVRSGVAHQGPRPVPSAQPIGQNQWAASPPPLLAGENFLHTNVREQTGVSLCPQEPKNLGSLFLF